MMLQGRWFNYLFVMLLTVAGCTNQKYDEESTLKNTEKTFNIAEKNTEKAFNNAGHVSFISGKDRDMLLSKFIENNDLSCNTILEAPTSISDMKYAPEIIRNNNKILPWLRSRVTRLACIQVVEDITIDYGHLYRLAMLADSMDDQSDLHHFIVSWVQFQYIDDPGLRLSLLLLLEPWEGRLYGQPDDAPPVRPYSSYQAPIIREIDLYIHE